MDFSKFKTSQLKAWLNLINLSGVSKMSKDELVRYVTMYFPLIQRRESEKAMKHVSVEPPQFIQKSAETPHRHTRDTDEEYVPEHEVDEDTEDETMDDWVMTWG